MRSSGMSASGVVMIRDVKLMPAALVGAPTRLIPNVSPSVEGVFYKVIVAEAVRETFSAASLYQA